MQQTNFVDNENILENTIVYGGPFFRKLKAQSEKAFMLIPMPIKEKYDAAPKKKVNQKGRKGNWKPVQYNQN